MIVGLLEFILSNVHKYLCTMLLIQHNIRIEIKSIENYLPGYPDYAKFIHCKLYPALSPSIYPCHLSAPSSLHHRTYLFRMFYLKIHIQASINYKNFFFFTRILLFYFFLLAKHNIHMEAIS